MSSHKHWQTDKSYLLCERTDCGNSNSTKNVEKIGGSLVPQAALLAGAGAAGGKQFYYQKLGVEPDFTMLVGVTLEAAAPHVRADALDSAADYISRHGQGMSADWAVTQLLRMIDELAEAGETERLHHTNDTDRLHGGGVGQ